MTKQNSFNSFITFRDILEAKANIEKYLKPTPLRTYDELNECIGHGIKLFVKHENHQPTNAFKIRNAFAALCALTSEQRQKGVVAATRGNHGLGVAYAAKTLGIQATICVPEGNNSEKNSGIQSLGARLIVHGCDYEESMNAMKQIVENEGAIEIHSTNNKNIIAGAGTLSLEMLEEVPHLDILVMAVGGGSQVMGAITVAQAVNPRLKVIGVQAAGASAIHDSWHSKNIVTHACANTIADGLATRKTSEVSFWVLQNGLSDFITVTDSEIAEAIRIILKTTHNLVEGAGAAGLAGALKISNQYAGKNIGIVLSGGNIDQVCLLKVLNHAI